MRQKKQAAAIGLGQLTLVEHSLCPLDHRASLVDNLIHQATFQYSDRRGKRQTARSTVFSPLGLSASDEFYLWGLLALTLSQGNDRSDLVATPHWCLRQLGAVAPRSARGGEQYRMFRDSIRRLAATSYLCDAFYDPMRGEHRAVSFHFLSYTLPVEPESCRAWRLNWDPTFIELVNHEASRMRFDLALYRRLDPASRRLFLFLTKILHRKKVLPRLRLEHLAIDVIGFSSSVARRDLRVKVMRCLKRLDSADVIRDPQISRIYKGTYIIQASRGAYFEQRHRVDAGGVVACPVWESLVHLGFDNSAASRLVRTYPLPLLEDWVDITQAALERHGKRFFKKSPMAYLVDSVDKAHAGQRTPPDWWHEVRRRERDTSTIEGPAQEVFEKIRRELFGRQEHRESRAKSNMCSGVDLLK